MIEYPDIGEWTLEDITNLLDEEHEEGQHLEFKSQLKGHKDRLEEEMVAFANVSGGFIVFGVSDQRKPVGIEGSPDEEVTQYLKEVVRHTNPTVRFKVGSPIYLSDDNKRAIWVVEVQESNNKPVSTKNAGYFIRTGESAQPIPRESLKTLFVDADRKQRTKRLLAMELRRFIRAYEDQFEGVGSRYLDGEPQFQKFDTEAIRTVLRENPDLYREDEKQELIDRVFEGLQEIDDWEKRFKDYVQGKLEDEPNFRSPKERNRKFNEQLRRRSKILKQAVEELLDYIEEEG